MRELSTRLAHFPRILSKKIEESPTFKVVHMVHIFELYSVVQQSLCTKIEATCRNDFRGIFLLVKIRIDMYNNYKKPCTNFETICTTFNAIVVI